MFLGNYFAIMKTHLHVGTNCNNFNYKCLKNAMQELHTNFARMLSRCYSFISQTQIFLCTVRLKQPRGNNSSLTENIRSVCMLVSKSFRVRS